MKILIRSISKMNLIASKVVGIIIAFLAFLVFYDVIGRYFFGSPSSFGYDLTTWLIATVTMIGGGYVLLADQHIRIDVLYERYSLRGKCIVGIVTDVFVLLIVFALFWYGGQQALNYAEKGAVASTGFNVPLWFLWIIMPIGGIVLLLQAIIQIFYDIYGLITGQPHELDTRNVDSKDEN